MKLITALVMGLGRLDGSRVCRDRFLPVADAGEDMRRHMQRVRRIGRNRRIFSRRGKSLRRKFCGVGGMLILRAILYGDRNRDY